MATVRGGAAVSRASALAGAARALAGAVCAFALPQRCPGCGGEAAPERLLCEPCHAAIPPLAAPLCTRCLKLGREPVGCRRHAGRETWAARLYDERAARLVHAFKYDGRAGLANTMAEAIAGALPSSLRPDLVIGAPLHPARRRERGFDQAARLADALAGRLGAPCLPGALLRTRPTRTQALLPERERRTNLEGAFAAPEPARLRGRRVLVVDDVVTTGATLDAALEALAAAGAHPTGAAYAWAQ